MKKYLIIVVCILIAPYVNAQDLNTQLDKAIVNKDTSNVRILLDKGANANYRPKMGQAEMVLLVKAVLNQDLVSVKLLIEHKADVDARDWFKTTPLMYAANSGNLEIVNYLIQHGADVKASDGTGNSVLSAAKEGKNSAVINLIEAKLKQ